ncbi:MAG TPA: S1/P1 nuclease [Opitutaceae bacterium]|jgi:hypothetical protein
MIATLRRAALTVGLGLFFATPAYPWAEQGHRALAMVAALKLNPQARAHVVKILGNDDLAAVAVWMDELRSAAFHTGPLASDPEALKFNAQFPENGQWHYVDLPLGTKAYELDDPFANPHDVVHMLEEAVQVLEGGGDRRITPRQALRMIVHFVGDEHQPLHVGNGYYKVAEDGSVTLVKDPQEAKGLPNDKGGNDLFFGPGRYDELHAYWDAGLVTKIAQTEGPEELAKVIEPKVEASRAAWKASGDYHHWPETWATESLVAARIAYTGIVFGKETPGAKGAIRRIAITLPSDYDERCVPVAEERLAQAASHLADLLNAIHWAD